MKIKTRRNARRYAAMARWTTAQAERECARNGHIWEAVQADLDKKYGDGKEVVAGFLGYTGNMKPVFQLRNCHSHVAKELVKKALKCLFPKGGVCSKTIAFTSPVGKTALVTLDAKDAGKTYYAKRPGRATASRLIDKAQQETADLTVVIGEHASGYVLYTAYPGAPAPREMADIRAEMALPEAKDRQVQLQAALEESARFWAKHALVAESTND